MTSIGIARVERSEADKFKEGSLVMCYAMCASAWPTDPSDLRSLAGILCRAGC